MSGAARGPGTVAGTARGERLANSPFLFDLRAVGLFRVLLALTILCDQLVRGADWQAFHGAAGLVPLADSRAWESAWGWSLYWLSDGPLLPHVLEGIRVLATAALLFGIRSRIAAWVLFAVLASAVARNPLIIQGGDAVLVVTTFFAGFLPLGARFSLERLWFGPEPGGTCRSAATVGFAVQVLLVWFMSGILKGHEWHTAGTAISMALHLEAFAAESSRLWRDWDWLTHSLTYVVYWLECVAPVLALLPSYWSRIAGLGALVALEVGIAVSLEVGLFPLISLVSLVPLVPVRLADRLSARGEAAGAGLVLYYDANCRFCLFACRLLQAIGRLQAATVRTAQSDPVASRILEESYAWSVALEGAPEDGYRRGWDAVRFVLGVSKRRWLLRLLPGRARGARVYSWIGAHRDRFGAAGAFCFGREAGAGRHGPVGRFVVSGALVVVLAWNVVSFPAVHERADLRALVRPLAATLHLEQYWNMFAPHPYTYDVWHAIPGMRRDGSDVDLLTRETLDLTAPVDGPARYGGYRWRKAVFRSVERGEVARVLAYFCRTGEWAAMDLWEFRRPNPGTAGMEPVPYRPHRVARWQCDGVDERDVEAFRNATDATMASYLGAGG